MLMEYQTQMENEEETVGAGYESKYEFSKVHLWRPPCSCGVELDSVLESYQNGQETVSKVHLWRPPCSCGVSLDDVVE